MATAALEADPRLKLATWIEGTPERQRQPIGMRSGRTGSKTDAMQLEIAAAASSFVRVVDDVRTSPNLSRSQQAQRIEEAGHNYAAKLKDAASVLAGEAEQVKSFSMRANFTKSYEERPPRFDEVMADQTLALRFAGLDASHRAAKLAALTHEPVHNLREAEAMLRQPLAISGLTADEYHAVRAGVLKAFDPATYNAIHVMVGEVQQGQQAVQHAAALLRREAPAVMTELSVTSPGLMPALIGTGDFA
jgi:hypothetical protein